MTEPPADIDPRIEGALRAALACLSDTVCLSLDDLRARCSWMPGEEPAVIDALRQLGVHVDARKAWLDDDIEVLSEASIRAGVSRAVRAWLRELNVCVLTDSTNTRIMTRASSDTVDGLAYLADAQTAGRGRRGRRWLSPFARNIALSLGMRLPRPASELGPLSLVVGLAVIDTLVTLKVPGVALKWPNDIMLDGRKLGGILIELARTDASSSEIVIGVGLNVISSPGVHDRVDQPVAALDETGLRYGRNALAAALISSIHAYGTRFVEFGFEPMRRVWDQYDLNRGRQVHLRAGDRTLVGQVLGIDDRGALVLDTAAGVRTFSGGEISVRSVAQRDAESDWS
jgi:BirA family transcriptional regulator, biotin operon repressor / biotin---[acetyl-CoA-carboxylase] ligase